MKNISELQKRVFETATNSGWHDLDERVCTSSWWRRMLRPFGVRQTFGAPTPRQKLAWIALITDELDEAAREDEYLYYGSDEKPEGIVIELIDALIRLMDMAGACKIDLGRILIDEHYPCKYRIFRYRNNLVTAIRSGSECPEYYASLFLAIEKMIKQSLSEAKECGKINNPPSIEDLIIIKDAYNRTRGYRHGGKLA